MPSPVATENTTVVVPTLNERDNIAKILEALFDLYPAIHVLVVDDSSPDGTAGVVREMLSRYRNLMLLVRTDNRGFAPSYRDDFRQVLAEAWCRAVVTMDADFSHDPAVIGKMLGRLAASEVVVGSRYIEGGSVRNWNWRRRMLSRAANYYVRAVLRFGVRDTTSGFVGMRREALERSGVERTASAGYAFMVEMKYLLWRTGSTIVEHPISFDERREGESKMSAGKVWESIWLPWRIRLKSGNS